MGQELHSCDTTQIDMFPHIRSLMRSIKRIPMDNGWVPVGRYSINSFAPPSTVHSFCRADRASTAHSSLNGVCAEILLCIKGLFYINYVLILV